MIFVFQEKEERPTFDLSCKEDDPLDSIEERPTFDVSATYMSDEEINKMYPKHPIDVSYNIVE